MPLPARLTFRLWNGLMVVEGGIDRSPDQRVALATGLSACAVLPDLAAKLNLEPIGKQPIRTAFGKAEADSLPPSLLRLQAVVVVGMPLLRFDVPQHLSGREQAEAPAIWVGAPLLHLYTVSVEPERGELVFDKPDGALPPRSTVVPLEFRDGQPVVLAKLNNKHTFPCVVDTATLGTLLPAAVVQEQKLPILSVVPVTLPSGKPGRVAEVMVKELAIGGVKFRDFRAFYVAEGEGAPELAILGADLLRQYRVTFALAQRKLAFSKPTPPDKPKAAEKAAGGRS